jgi:hypothetical protein
MGQWKRIVYQYYAAIARSPNLCVSSQAIGLATLANAQPPDQRAAPHPLDSRGPLGTRNTSVAAKSIPAAHIQSSLFTADTIAYSAGAKSHTTGVS